MFNYKLANFEGDVVIVEACVCWLLILNLRSDINWKVLIADGYGFYDLAVHNNYTFVSLKARSTELLFKSLMMVVILFFFLKTDCEMKMVHGACAVHY